MAATLSAQRRRLAAQALMATRDRLAADPSSALLAVASVPTPKEVVMTTPAVSATALDLAAFIAQGQQLLASLTPAAPAPVASPAPAAPAATSGLAKAQAFWQSDYEGKGVGVRQLSNGRWVDVKGAFCKPPKGAPKIARKPEAAAVAPVPAPVSQPAFSAAALAALSRKELLDLVAQLAALDAAPAAPAPAPAKKAAAPAPAPARKVVPGLDTLVRLDGQWLRCLHCDAAYWSTHREASWVVRKATKHVAKAHPERS